VHLKSLTLKGFKSFPDRTRLDFGPGVSVIVGPNGSGKSNITDAVLWAMGEQSPLAVRGQSMQDIIFGGGRGVQARSSVEVEIVLDNSDGTVALPLSEISIARRLDRAGEGEYRLNGARCRLVDVIEVLSDTGLGKETHSVISQGRVEAIVSSKPRDRRMLIEEAAGLGKHRKRRRRAQLKLERTQENLDRALDVEREARSRLRPLKRQAEAAELHQRLERQTLEARLELARDALRVRRAELADAEAHAQRARAAREEVEGGLQEVVERRSEAERALAERSSRHDALARRALHASSAQERLGLRREQAAAAAEGIAERVLRVQRDIDILTETLSAGHRQGTDADHANADHANADHAEVDPAEIGRQRIAVLEEELALLEQEREEELQCELAQLEADREAAAAALAQLDASLAEARSQREHADAVAQAARGALREAEHAVEAARREAARVGGELAAVNQFLRTHTLPPAAANEGAPATGGVPRALSEALRVKPGYELALAAALGGRLDAVLAPDLPGAAALLDRAGPDGATVLLADLDAAPTQASRVAATPPTPGAQRLIELLDGPPAVVALAGRLLADAWVLESFEELPEDFAGIAVTPRGRVWFAAQGEVRQVPEGGAERVLARRNEREELILVAEAAAGAEHVARAAAERAHEDSRAADLVRERVEEALREADRNYAQARERERHAGWLIEQRRAAPDQGPLAVRRAQLGGELAAERRQAERIAREHAERLQRLDRLRAQLAADTALGPLAERLATALAAAGEAVAERVAELEGELARHRAAGEEMAAELRACAAREADIQARLRAEGEAVTAAEVAAQRLRDQAAEADLELRTVREQLELEQDEEELEPLDEEQVRTLEARLERLRRRREQLGPVNPLAQEEYAEALAHVEELEAQRTDLETALRELRTVIRDTDRQIHETFHATFEAAARNFEELARHVIPGGGGQLRLVKDAIAPRPVLGGQLLPDDGASAAPSARAEGAGAGGAGNGAAGDSGAGDAEAAAELEADAEAQRREFGEGGEEELLGVEIEIVPAGKSTKRLSLLSGGEKSMTALAFLFAVFLARPCPFYILDEVEAALDDLNLDRFLSLLRRYSDRAQFIVITHQKRTMEAADWLYGVSMAGNGVSKVLSRRLPPEGVAAPAATAAAATELPTEAAVSLAPPEEEVSLAPLEGEVSLAPLEGEVSLAPPEAEVSLASSDVDVSLASSDGEVSLVPSDEEASGASAPEQAPPQNGVALSLTG
jgi:chromosome segregation protein